MKKHTMPEIRQANLAAGFHTFERKTLRFFGETMRNWAVGPLTSDGKQIVIRHGGKAGNASFLFNPADASIRKVEGSK